MVEKFKQELLQDVSTGNEMFEKIGMEELQKFAEILAGSDFLRDHQEYPLVQHLQGMMSYYGWGVEQDYTKAREWFRDAIDNGSLSSQQYLGLIFIHGLGTPRDQNLAHQWFLVAVKNCPNKLSIYALGYLSYYGKGTKQDYIEARKWFRMGARNGCYKSQYYLGAMYYYGYGVDQDYAKAIKFLVSALIDVPQATDLLKIILANTKVYDTLIKIAQEYYELQEKVVTQQQYITELECRPPGVGGPEYEKTKQRWHDQLVEKK